MPEIITKKFSMIKNSLSVLLSLSLAACASGPVEHQPRLSPGLVAAQAKQQQAEQQSSDVVVEANPDQIRITPDSELSNDPDLPGQDLDAQTEFRFFSGRLVGGSRKCDCGSTNE